MTDEEKAEGYYRNYNFEKDFEGFNKPICRDVKKAYLDGLAEGRKEEDEKLFNNWCKGETPEPQECPFLQKLEKENAELKKDKEYLDKVNNEQTEVILKLQEQIEKMKQDQKTAYRKGMRHFANAMLEYDRTNGAWTDYFEHVVLEVKKRELAE